MDKILQTINLTKKYGSFTAVDNVSITVHKGDIYGLIGKNGAGKTTLMRMILGSCIKTKGEIIYDNNIFIFILWFSMFDRANNFR